MPLLGAKSAALLTKDEATLVRSSAAAAAKNLTPSRLKEQIARARKLRDKYADLAKRQSGEAKGAREPRGGRGAEGNENTEKKVALFADALTRFEKELARRDGKAAAKTSAKGKAKKAKPKASAKAAAKTTKKGNGKRRSGAAAKAASGSALSSSESAIAKRADLQRAKSGLPRSAGHMAARGRRNQARRDARR